jgi:hypothetical protein
MPLSVLCIELRYVEVESSIVSKEEPKQFHVILPCVSWLPAPLRIATKPSILTPHQQNVNEAF